MATDYVDAPVWDDEPFSGDPSEVMRLAELFPTVPLRTLVRELLHAQAAIATGSRDRDAIVAQTVAARLAAHHGDGSDQPRQEPT
jgi:hypothetical protein